jgi:hypothetical protein
MKTPHVNRVLHTSDARPAGGWGADLEVEAAQRFYWGGAISFHGKGRA